MLKKLLFALALMIPAQVFDPFAINIAYAADGDVCQTAGNQPGLVANSATTPTCDPVSSPATGTSCGGANYYSQDALMCVANGAACTGGTYSSGICAVTPVGTPGTPTPAGFTAFTAPVNPGSGSQAPICMNTSPFIGAGIGVVSGTVLCYTAQGKNSEIYAYQAVNGGQWSGLNADSFYARDDITAAGTLSAYGNAQLYSTDGNTGLQIQNGTALIQSGDSTSTSSIITTPGSITIQNADTGGTVKSYIQVTNDGVSVSSASDAGALAAVTINGIVSGANTSNTGVLLTGDGQNGAVATGGVAPWADVAIYSAHYATGAANGLGSAIIVNDYGITMVSPPLKAATNNVSQNNIGSGKNNEANTTLTNIIGEGGPGTVINVIGSGGTTSTSVTTNTFGSAGTNGATVTNNFGTGTTGPTINNFGNTNADTTILQQAGTTQTIMSNGVYGTSVGSGVSILGNPTQLVTSFNSITMKDATGDHVVVDANGQITIVNGTAAQASNAVTVTNGYGNTHGLIVTETQTTLSGGTHSTSLTMNNNSATFSNSATGDPIQVHGIADGTSPYDAVNLRQLQGGLASLAALSSLPTPQAGKNHTFGVGFGYNGYGYSVALGGQSQILESLALKYGAAWNPSEGDVGPVINVGLGFSW
ncbi:MAG: hypothetical protein JKY99_05365 [Rhizobiales bacterium]|nr:hypothetical protein [Hyphomicrobiales bacterium]